MPRKTDIKYNKSRNDRNSQLKGESDYSKHLADSGYFQGSESGRSQSDYYAAMLKSGLGGLPLVGGFFQGLDRMQQLTDMYNKTGKIPAYPTISGVGAGQLTSSIVNGAATIGKVAAGAHDLYQFYSGELDDFRNLTNNSYM